MEKQYINISSDLFHKALDSDERFIISVIRSYTDNGKQFYQRFDSFCNDYGFSLSTITRKFNRLVDTVGIIQKQRSGMGYVYDVDEDELEYYLKYWKSTKKTKAGPGRKKASNSTEMGNQVEQMGNQVEQMGNQIELSWEIKLNSDTNKDTTKRTNKKTIKETNEKDVSLGVSFDVDFNNIDNEYDLTPINYKRPVVDKDLTKDNDIDDEELQKFLLELDI
jgi:hypothetical protein